MSKMYIAVLETVPDHMVPVLVAHSALNAHIYFSRPIVENNSTYLNEKCNYAGWLKDSFRKVVLKVNMREFEKILELPFVYQGHENTVLNGSPSCLVVCPREQYPRVLQFAKMWKPSDTDVANRLTIKVAALEKEVSDYRWQESPGQGAY